MTLKNTAIELLCSKALQTAINPLLKNNAAIFMLHRFASEKFSTTGHNPEFLRACLLYLKSSGRNIVSLDELFLSLIGKSKPIPNAVVFTIDDGFLDQAEIGAEVFCDVGLPVTICLISQLIEQSFWLAESRIAFLIESTTKSVLEIDFESRQFSFDLRTPGDQNVAARELVYYCKSLPLETVEQFIAKLSKSLAVDVPARAPLKYRGMDWEAVGQLESRGVSFCAHTENHPALGAESDIRSKTEISESYSALQRNTKHPSRVFCYPTGRPTVDYSAREEQYAKEAGCIGAISAVPGYVNLARGKSTNIYSVPRFSLPDNMQDFKQIIHHLEFIKDSLRGHSS